MGPALRRLHVRRPSVLRSFVFATPYNPTFLSQKKKTHTSFLPLSFCARGETGCGLRKKKRRGGGGEKSANSLGTPFCAEGAQVKFFVTAGGAKIQF